jgi:predicted MFS family arabinose efflux permease
MLLVYAVTRTADSGWTNGLTLALLAASAVLMAAFLAIELRSPAPLLPMRIFRNRTLTAANVIALLVGTIMFSQFFLQTLYMQDVLHYSPIQGGAAFLTMTLAIIVFSNVGQQLVGRMGVRRVLTTGLVLDTAALALLTRVPVDGHYAANLFPAYLIGGLGMALTFVPMTIAGLTGVSGPDAGIASGLLNTSRQIGGAVGLAVVSTIAASYAGHGTLTPTAAAGDLTDGLQLGFEVLTGVTVVAVLVSLLFLAPARRAVAASEPISVESLDRVQEAVH